MKMAMALMVVVGVGAASVVAQDAPAAKFRNSLSLGVAMTDGNSETMQINGALLVEGDDPGIGSIRLGIEANYGESTVNSNSETTVKNGKVFASTRKTISPRFFGALDVSTAYDDIARIDYRTTVGPGLGVYVVKSEATALSVEAAPSYVWEEVADVNDSYLGVRFAEMLQHALGGKAKAWQSAEYLPKVSDFQDYLLNGALGVEAPVSASVNLRVVLQDKYDSTPAPGAEHNDISLIAGLTLAL